MTVRAKFKVASIGRVSASVATGERDENGYRKYADGELQTVKMSPVYGNGDPGHENNAFWEATPSGKVTLSMVNESAGRYFELGAEYYLDFVKAA